MFSKKATEINEIFTVHLLICSKCQINGEVFLNFVAFLENMNFNNESLLALSGFQGRFLILTHFHQEIIVIQDFNVSTLSAVLVYYGNTGCGVFKEGIEI